MNHFKQIAAAMEAQGLDAVLLTCEANRFYASGFHSTGTDGVAVVTRNRNYYFTDSRYTEAAGRLVQDAEIRETNREHPYADLINEVIEKEKITRFAEDFKTAKKYLSSIGPVQSINACLCSSLCVYNPAEENSGAYSLLHDGTHLVDAVLYFLEKDSQISGTIQKAYHEEKKGGLLSMAKSITEQKPSFTLSQLLNEPVLTGIFRDEKQNIRQFSAHYSNGLCPDITISMSGRSRFFSFEVTITGTQGRICIGNGYLKLYRRENSTLYSGFYSLAADKSVKLPKKTLFFANMIKNAVDFLDNRAPLLSTIQSGINALAVLEEIKRLFQKQ